MPEIDDILKPYLQQFEQNIRQLKQGTPYTSGLLGMVIDSVAVVIDGNNPSKYFVRLPDGTFTRALHMGRVAPVYNQPVDIRRNALGIYEITGITRGQEEAAGVNDPNSFVGPHQFTAHINVDITDLGDQVVPVYNDATSTWIMKPLRQVDVYTDDVSNPPTAAELDAILTFSPSGSEAGLLFMVDDNGADTNVYLIGTNGTSWWIFTGTKAT